MKKEIISVFDGEIERKPTSAEEVGRLIFWTFATPILLMSIPFFLLALFIIFVSVISEF